MVSQAGHKAGSSLGFEDMPQNIDMVATAFLAIKNFIPFLFALCFHEFAHGWVARLRGDRTAETMGRLTLNPLAHADMFGTFLLPLLSIIQQIQTPGLRFPFFGWAKPVPVDERNLKNPRTDMFWIAAAGPLSNILMAFVASIALGLFVRALGEVPTGDQNGKAQILEIAVIFININVVLAVFNLLPIYPLDGAKVLARFLPDRINDQLEALSTYSMIILMLCVFFFRPIIALPANWIMHAFMWLIDGVAFA